MSSLKPEGLSELIVHMYRASAVGRYCGVLVWGEAGIGKSETVRRASNVLQIGLRDLRLSLFEAVDLIGIPKEQEVFPCFLDERENSAVRGKVYTRRGLLGRIVGAHPTSVPKGILAGDDVVAWAIEEARKAGLGWKFSVRTVASPPSWFPVPGTAGIVFLDEINRARKDVLRGVFQLLLDRQVGDQILPARWIIVAACNPPGSVDEEGRPGHEVTDVSDPAFLGRFCHIASRPSVADWLAYARATRKALPSVRAFVRKGGPEALGSEREVEIPQMSPNPRGWTLVHKIVADVPSVEGAPGSELSPEIAQAVSIGIVGVHATRMWYAMRTIPDQPVLSTELFKDPVAAVERMRVFLDYPVRDTEGNIEIDESGRPKTITRTDLLRLSFVSVEDALVKLEMKLTPQTFAAVMLFLVTAIRPRNQGGLGLEVFATEYLKRWINTKKIGTKVGLVPIPTSKAQIEACEAAGVRIEMRKNMPMIPEIVDKLTELRALEGFTL